MRALAGAIIMAGALIGLGLTALGIGSRYALFAERDRDNALMFLKFKQLDTPLMIILVVLLAALVYGLGVATLGLMFHHERRHHERQLTLAQTQQRPHITV